MSAALPQSTLDLLLREHGNANKNQSLQRELACSFFGSRVTDIVPTHNNASVIVHRIVQTSLKTNIGHSNTTFTIFQLFKTRSGSNTCANSNWRQAVQPAARKSENSKRGNQTHHHLTWTCQVRMLPRTSFQILDI
jgi:hypothetical protein